MSQLPPNSLKVSGYFRRFASALDSIQVTESNRELSLDVGASLMVEFLLRTKRDKKKVLIVGNGGSAAIASHAQNDVVKTVGVRALVFNEAALLTALANDHGYPAVFAAPVAMWAEHDDVLIAISSSGKSQSILNAVSAARKNEARVITLSGFQPDNPLRAQGDLNFFVPALDYGTVELAHACILHFLTDTAMETSRLA